MRYRLRTLLILLAVAPLAIALAYWAIEFALGEPLKIQLYLAFCALAVYSWIALWQGLNRTVFGPSAAQSWRRKQRRRIRVRLERYAGGST